VDFIFGDDYVFAVDAKPIVYFHFISSALGMNPPNLRALRLHSVGVDKVERLSDVEFCVDCHNVCVFKFLFVPPNPRNLVEAGRLGDLFLFV
jgi:hypothetical protein